jgi:hypothetical protein
VTPLQAIGKIGTKAVQELRLQKLQKGLPFMINSKNLKPNECYLEYPDGLIQLVFLKWGAKEFTVVRDLSQEEKQSLRKKYGLDVQ